MEIIKCEKLNFRYALSDKPALRDIDFCVNDGDFCLILGKSGVGKSTLLKLLKKEIAPVGELTGRITVSASVGYVSQNVEENIVTNKVRSELSFGLENMNMSYDEIELLVNETASYFNLSEKLDKEVSSLSGGEKQILNLASVMIMKPQILILDEPSSQLDPISAERFISTVLKLHNDFSTTIVMSEHMSGELFSKADRVLLMQDGTVIENLPPKSMIGYLISSKSEMLDAVPIQQRLYENASTVSECRQIVREKGIKSLDVKKERAEIALKAKHISFAYNKNEDVLSDLSLEIYDGKINAVLGNNASGKSTLLKVMSRVLCQHHGKIKADKRVALLCQNPFDLFTKEKCSDEAVFGELTDFLEIDDIKNSHPFDISGGQAQRLALAKVLQTNADIILLDEPTKALDCVLKVKLAQKLRELCDMGKTIVIASHDIDFVGEYADFVSFISNGKIVSTNARQEFFSSLNFYTTTVSRITNGIAKNVVSLSDLEQSGGMA